MRFSPEVLSVVGAAAVTGGQFDFAEKVTLGGLFAALLWFVLGQFRDLALQVRAQNDALIGVVRENTAALSKVADRLDGLEEQISEARR